MGSGLSSVLNSLDACLLSGKKIEKGGQIDAGVFPIEAPSESDAQVYCLSDSVSLSVIVFCEKRSVRWDRSDSRVVPIRRRRFRIRPKEVV